jgi:selenocysteine lyase/cysteine desulfurase
MIKRSKTKKPLIKSQNQKWLNSACLGHFGPGLPRSIHNAHMNISDTLDGLGQWIIDWTKFRHGRVGFVGSTTAACDAVLFALAADREVYLHTSGAHPTIAHAVRVAARLAGHLRGLKNSVHEIDLENLKLGSGSDVAQTLAARVVSAVGARKGVLVLEHVTYNHGLRLPIDDIARALATRCPNVKIVIDGAQAVGLWRPQGAPVAAYIGCFHKYIAAPPSTGFLVVEPDLARWLPAHVQPMCESKLELGLLATIDLTKWVRVLDILRERTSIDDLANRLDKVKYFNQKLEFALSPCAISLGADYDPELRSHISTVSFQSDRAAEAIQAILWKRGFAIQRFDNLVRVSMGHETPAGWGAKVGSIIRSFHEKDHTLRRS